MSEEFWNNKISVGYYDKLHTSGLKKGRGFQTGWHHSTFLIMSEKIEKNQIHLDFACGPGTFIREYLNNSSTGVDVSEKQIEYAKKFNKKNNYYTVSEFKKLNFTSNFDVITVIGLLEFLSDEEIVDLIKYLKNLLKKHGKIILTTPNFRGLMLIFSYMIKYFSDVNYDDQWVKKRGKKDILKIFKENNINNYEIEKNLNIGLLLSTLNIKLGLIVNNIVSKISMFNFGWILFIKISK